MVSNLYSNTAEQIIALVNLKFYIMFCPCLELKNLLIGHMQILGTGMSAKMWEVTVEHARTCVLDKRMYLYCPPNSQQKTGVVFNVVGQVMGLLSEGQHIPIDNLSETDRVLYSSTLIFFAFCLSNDLVTYHQVSRSG